MICFKNLYKLFDAVFFYGNILWPASANYRILQTPNNINGILHHQTRTIFCYEQGSNYFIRYRTTMKINLYFIQVLIDFVQRRTIPYQKKLCKNYTNCVQKRLKNNKFVYILYTKIAQIKISYDHECARYAHQIPTYI